MLCLYQSRFYNGETPAIRINHTGGRASLAKFIARAVQTCDEIVHHTFVLLTIDSLVLYIWLLTMIYRLEAPNLPLWQDRDRSISGAVSGVNQPTSMLWRVLWH